MGIPSVKTFDIDITRTYKDINSTNMYIPGDRIIAKITEISKVNKDSDKEIILARDTASGVNNKIIDSGGEYVYTKEQFHVATSDYYKGCYYNAQIGINSLGAYTTNTDLDITEQVTSLKKTVSISPKNKISVDHFFDMNSYNSIGISSINRKFNFTDVYEITDATELAKLNTDLGDIGITQYTNHENKIKDWTLLYLDGKFRTNSDKTYPDINDYVYDSVNIPDKYDKGTTSYDTTGSSTGDSGYKWIVFRIDKTNSFVKSASKIGGGVAKPYIDVPGLLINHGFSSSVYDDSSGIGKGFGSQNVIGFVRINSSKKSGGHGFQIANFTKDLNQTPAYVWYSGDNTSQVNLDTVLDEINGGIYGGRLDTTQYNVANGWGVECPDPDSSTAFNSSDTNIDIFVGLKNTENLN